MTSDKAENRRCLAFVIAFIHLGTGVYEWNRCRNATGYKNSSERIALDFIQTETDNSLE